MSKFTTRDLTFAAMVAAGEGERGGLAAGYAEREAF